jgi:Aromatic-ring hydroxylase, C-terminal
VRDEFLDSYHAERWPVGQFLLRFTDRLFSLATSTNPIVAWLRGAAAPRAAAFVFTNDRARNRALRTVSQLGIHYKKSPIVREGHGVKHGPRAGERMIDAPFEGSTLFALLARPSHQLLFVGSGADESDLYEAHAIDASLAKTLGIEDGGCYLVRPDGYVAFRSGPQWRFELREYLHQLFGTFDRST